MNPSIIDRVVRVLGWCVFGLAVGAPLIGLLIDVVSSGQPPRGGWWLSEGQWMLLGKSAVLGSLAGIGSLVLAVPGAMVIAGRRGSVRPILMVLFVCPLLFPPTVTAFGWDKLTASDAPLAGALRWAGLAALTEGPARTVWVWSCWLWPVAALLLWIGWRRQGRAAYELAIIDAGRARALVFGALPAMRLFPAAAWIAVFAICMTDYQVPHACGQLVYATELMSWVTETGRSIDVAWPALPLVGLIVLVVVGLLRWARRGMDFWTFETRGRSLGGPRSVIVLCIVVGVTVAAPIGALIVSTDLGPAMTRAWAVYAGELGDSLAVAGAAMIGSVLVGEALCGGGRVGHLLAVVMLLGGVLPGALVGQSLVATYLRIPAVYDHWPVMVLTQVARFGWIGVLAAWVSRWSFPAHTLEQARVDGASEAQVKRFVYWPVVWPIVAAGGAAFVAMAIAEVPATSLTRVPGIGSVALRLIEEFHRFQDDMLVALSLWLCAAVLPAAALLTVALYRRRMAIA